MLNQPRGGHIFNIDGAGSDGRPTPRYLSFFVHIMLPLALLKPLKYNTRIDEIYQKCFFGLNLSVMNREIVQ